MRLQRAISSALALGVALGALIGPSSVAGTHPLYTGERVFWDENFDGIPDGDIPLYIAGGGWQSNRIARLDDAILTWRAALSNYFKPSRKAPPAPPAAQHFVYIDGTSPWCGPFAQAAAARSCVSENDVGSYHRIWDVDTFLNWNNQSFCTDDAPPPVTWCWDFEGVLVHELGHWAYLFDLLNEPGQPVECVYSPSTALHTMCSLTQAQTLSFSYNFRSLTASDIRDVDRLYPVPTGGINATLMSDQDAVLIPESIVKDHLEIEFGFTCFQSSETLLGWPTLSSDEAVQLGAVVDGRWFEPESRWVGSVDALLGELGAVPVVDAGDAQWIIVGGEHPYAQELVRIQSSGGVEAWQLVDQIRNCDDPAWPETGE